MFEIPGGDPDRFGGGSDGPGRRDAHGGDGPQVPPRPRPGWRPLPGPGQRPLRTQRRQPAGLARDRRPRPDHEAAPPGAVPADLAPAVRDPAGGGAPGAGRSRPAPAGDGGGELLRRAPARAAGPPGRARRPGGAHDPLPTSQRVLRGRVVHLSLRAEPGARAAGRGSGRGADDAAPQRGGGPRGAARRPRRLRIRGAPRGGLAGGAAPEPAAAPAGGGVHVAGAVRRRPAHSCGFARRIGATVWTGSFVRKSRMIALQSAGFSWIRKWDVPGTTASSASSIASYISSTWSSRMMSASATMTRVRLRMATRSGRCIAASIATTAPSLCPTRWEGPRTTVSRNAMVSCAISSYVIGPSTSGVWPWPRRSG